MRIYDAGADALSSFNAQVPRGSTQGQTEGDPYRGQQRTRDQDKRKRRTQMGNSKDDVSGCRSELTRLYLTWCSPWESSGTVQLMVKKRRTNWPRYTTVTSFKISMADHACKDEITLVGKHV